MTVLYSTCEIVSDTSIQFLQKKGLKIDKWVCSTNDIYEAVGSMAEGSCLLVDNIQTLPFSIKGLASFLEYAYNKSIRILSLDGKIDIRRDFNSRLIVEALKLGAEVDWTNRSRRTRNALANIKEKGKVLGRPAGWRKNNTPPLAEVDK